MKNIHIIPTDKPSRIYLIKSNNKLGITSNNPEFTENFGGGTQNQNIYITSDEEIKEGDYVLNLISKEVYQIFELWEVVSYEKKIILTDNKDLIKDGVQAIDDEFLEWFVKNPSCERVKIERGKLQIDDDGQKYGFPDMSKYKIIIPGEEPKPHSFCETPESKCTMNYCDENGCQNRKRELVEPQEEPNPFELPKALPDDVFFKSLEEPKTNLERLPFPELVEEFAEYYKKVPLIEEPKQDYSEVHLRHCYQGEYEDGCKYGEDDCPAKPLEPKQETLTYSEAAKKEERIFNSNMLIKETLEDAMNKDGYHESDYDKIWREGVQFGAKWQAERMYSEEEVKDLILKFNNDKPGIYDASEWFEQYKKK